MTGSRGALRHATLVARVAAILVLVSANVALAQTDDDELTDEELRALEEALGADAAEREATSPPSQPAPASDATGTAVGRFIQSMNPDLSIILDAALAWFGDEPLQLGAHDPNKNGFTLQQLELSVSASVDPFFRFDANIVFALFGVEVEEAYGTTLSLPWSLQVRAGQFLTRFGRINPTHPHSWHFVDQPLVNGKFFGGEGSRGLGLELSWLTPLPWYVELVGSGTEAGGACCARSFIGADEASYDIESPADFLYTLAIKQFFDLDRDWGLFWGLSTQLGPNATGLDNRSEIYGTDLFLKYKPVTSPYRTEIQLQLEAMVRARQVPDDSLVDYGGYGQLVWKITPQWATGARAEYVSGLALDPLDPDWTEPRARYALQGTWTPSHFSRLRLQAGLDHPMWRDAPFWMAALALELVTGAHGSHSY